MTLSEKDENTTVIPDGENVVEEKEEFEFTGEITDIKGNVEGSLKGDGSVSGPSFTDVKEDNSKEEPESAPDEVEQDNNQNTPDNEEPPEVLEENDAPDDDNAQNASEEPDDGQSQEPEEADNNAAENESDGEEDGAQESNNQNEGDGVSDAEEDTAVAQESAPDESAQNASEEVASADDGAAIDNSGNEAISSDDSSTNSTQIDDKEVEKQADEAINDKELNKEIDEAAKGETPAPEQTESTENSKDSKEKDDKKKDKDKKDDKESKDSDNPAKDGEDAKKGAEDAKKGAEDAKKGAEDAKKGAEAAKDAKDNIDDAKKGAEAAKDAKNLADGAKDAGKGNKLNDAKEAADKTAEAVRRAKEQKSLKGITGAAGQRAALKAMKNELPWAAAVDGIISILDKIIGEDKVDKILDTLGDQAYKTLVAGTISIIMSVLFPIMMIILMIYMIFTPMLENIEKFDEGARKAANTIEKFRNLYINHNFVDSKEAFYMELERLDGIYGDDLDETLLLATTFYPDMKTGYKTHYDSIGDILDDVALGGDTASLSPDTEDGQAYVSTLSRIVFAEIKSLVEEADGTYDTTTGLAYTTGKVYRLRSLASHMFASTLFGSAEDYNTKEVNLGEWLNKYYFNDDSDLKTLFNQVMTDILSGLATAGLGYAASAALPTVGVVIPDPIVATISAILTIYVAIETTEQVARSIDDITRDVELLVNCIFLGYMSIQSIDFNGADVTKLDSILENATITYYSYKYSEENYKKYLREVYIPNSPEFTEFLSYDKDGKPTEASIERIINEIFEYKYYFEQLFYVPEEDDSEGYSKLCLGAIDRKLASAMSLPVDISSGRCIEFLDNNAYGYSSSGLLHNGIELNEQSTGNKQGDSVYAVMDGGTVKSSSADSTLECVGGCIEIEYKYNTSSVVGGSTYDFSVIYKGLSKSSVTLKTGDTVTNRQQVGTIGTTEESENMKLPSLYLEFRTSTGTAIDPTNMIVKCSSQGVTDYPGATTITVPQTFSQLKHHTTICYSEKGYYFGCNKDDDRSWKEPCLTIHNIWLAQGARFKNGVAVVNVDGVDRYLAAVKPRIGETGDVVNAKLENGTVVPLLIADTKASDATHDWGHDYGGVINVIELMVRYDEYHNINVNVNNNWGVEWDTTSPVVEFSNAGAISSGKFDIPEKKLGDPTSTTASQGSELELCDSMYSGGKVNAYVNKAIEMANDDTIGYSATSTNLKPDVDSASFIYYSLANSQTLTDKEGPFLTNTMGAILERNGFEKMEYNDKNLKKGDIIVDHDSGADGYTVMYIGDGKQVAANPAEADDKPGDESKKEVAVSSFVSDSRYHEIYRYNYEKQYGPIGGSSGGKGNYKATQFTTQVTFSDEKFNVVRTSYSGGLFSFQKMLDKNGIKQTAKSAWGGCCGGFAGVQACAYYRGQSVTQSSGHLSSCNGASFGGCKNTWGRVSCYDDREKFIQDVIENLQEGHPVVIVVSGADQGSYYTRHFVTAVGYLDGATGTKASDLLVIDSYDAQIKRLVDSGKGRKLNGDGTDIHDGDCSSGQNHLSVVE